MQLNELGEFGLIGLIREKFASVSAAGYEGIGDDCAVMPCGDGTSLVVTTDMLIEEVHFRLCTTDPYRLGRKSLAVNLSDIAAMGAAPAASFLSIALPSDTAVEWVGRFLDGYRSLSSEFSVPLLGGDTTASPGKLAISVTAVGRVPTARQTPCFGSSRRQDFRHGYAGRFGSGTGRSSGRQARDGVRRGSSRPETVRARRRLARKAAGRPSDDGPFRRVGFGSGTYTEGFGGRSGDFRRAHTDPYDGRTGRNGRRGLPFAVDDRSR